MRRRVSWGLPRPTRAAVAVALALSALCTITAGMALPAHAAETAADLLPTLDALVRQGEDQPAAALAAIDALPATTAMPDRRWRALAAA